MNAKRNSLAQKVAPIAVASLLVAGLLGGAVGLAAQGTGAGGDSQATGGASAKVDIASSAKAASASAAGAAGSASADQAGQASAVIPGGWQLVADDTSMEANPDAQAALEEATSQLVGANYEPIALLGTQIVSGTNYCILCRVTPVTLNPQPHFSLVYVYAALDGSCKIIDTADLDIAPDLTE